MQESSQSKKHFNKQFKLDAASLVVEGGKKTADVARDVGVCYQTMHSWVKSYNTYKSEAFPGSGKQAGKDLELTQAREELRKLKMQVEFLKKTMFYFVEAPK